jgi:hypothetical protein
MKVNTFTVIAVKLFQVTNCFLLSRITKMDRMSTGVDKTRKLNYRVYSKVCYRIPPEHRTIFSKTTDDVLSLGNQLDKELTEFSKLFQKNDQEQKGNRKRMAELLTENFKLKKRVE